MGPIVSVQDVSFYSTRHSLFGFQSHRVPLLKGVSIDVYEGDIVGVVGTNGSGKSTFLRLLQGSLPYTGSIDFASNASVLLLSLGLGFKDELSGRDNITINGLMMGFDLAYVRSKVDSIIEFSELGERIDLAVRAYSDGMRARLAFSIAVKLEADIILIDEILSVGDSSFRGKAERYMKDMLARRKTAFFVSHDQHQINELCNKVLWLHKGKMMEYGETAQVMSNYNEFLNDGSNN